MKRNLVFKLEILPNAQGFNENTLKLEFKECGLLSRINQSKKDHKKGKGIIVDEYEFNKVFGL